MSAIIKILGGWRATAFAALAVLTLGAYSIEHMRRVRAQTAMADHLAQDAQAQIVAAQAARAKEYQATLAMAEIDRQTQERIKHAQDTADRTAAGLRAGTLRLREQWQGCQADRVSNAAAAAAELDGLARLRAASASRIVAAAARCDAQVAGLQAVVVADRKP